MQGEQNSGMHAGYQNHHRERPVHALASLLLHEHGSMHPNGGRPPSPPRRHAFVRSSPAALTPPLCPLGGGVPAVGSSAAASPRCALVVGVPALGGVGPALNHVGVPARSAVLVPRSSETTWRCAVSPQVGGARPPPTRARRNASSPEVGGARPPLTLAWRSAASLEVGSARPL